MLSDGAFALFATYAIVVTFDMLPLRLLNPAWIMTIALALSGNIAIPLAALAFLHVAAWMSPMGNSIQARRNYFCGMARWATLGFLLLLPLIGYATWAGINAIKIQNQIQLSNAQNTTQRLVKFIGGATSPAELQFGLEVLKGPKIPNQLLDQPLPILKKQALLFVNEGYKSYLRNTKQRVSTQRDPLYAQALKSILLSLVGVLAFAALSWNPIKQQSLLGELVMGDLSQIKSTLNPKRLIANFKLNLQQRNLSKDAREKVRELQKKRQAEAKLNVAATRKQNLERKRDMERYIKEEKRKRSNRID